MKVTKLLRDTNGLPIGTVNDNLILHSRVCEVEYIDRHKAALVANTIIKNLFLQVDKEGNRFVLLDPIAKYRLNSYEVK